MRKKKKDFSPRKKHLKSEIAKHGGVNENFRLTIRATVGSSLAVSWLVKRVVKVGLQVGFYSPEFIGTSVVVLAVPFWPGLRELEVLPKGSIRIASLLSRVEVPPGIFLSPLPPSLPFLSGNLAPRPLSSGTYTLPPSLHANHILPRWFPRFSTTIHFCLLLPFHSCQRIEKFSSDYGQLSFVRTQRSSLFTNLSLLHLHSIPIFHILRYVYTLYLYFS